MSLTLPCLPLSSLTFSSECIQRENPVWHRHRRPVGERWRHRRSRRPCPPAIPQNPETSPSVLVRGRPSQRPGRPAERPSSSLRPFSGPRTTSPSRPAPHGLHSAVSEPFSRLHSPKNNLTSPPPVPHPSRHQPLRPCFSTPPCGPSHRLPPTAVLNHTDYAASANRLMQAMQSSRRTVAGFAATLARPVRSPIHRVLDEGAKKPGGCHTPTGRLGLQSRPGGRPVFQLDAHLPHAVVIRRSQL